ncbi:TIGR01459 family HAD-type hydrolase [Roseicella frigidaeris]|uniref:TIGR01459 family HAD-type hydrolase n=1 Tax=Roseicella frigidaeris TaxID=2230885 RepID=A0A327M8I3_9PROT|nr:TIGR01459 family HAD-type hydrolase [Roseicella frigidaeris]RAI58765.1 TIGR01459 family HAD-type hydrolase [Roseicella frigidaeris]
MQILDGIAPLADRYDGYVLDLWGVVHDGKRPYPGVPEALGALKRAGKRVVFLTNAPRRSWFIAGMLDRMGLDRALYDGIISSGELAWRMLKARRHPWFARLGPRAVHIGPERDLSVVEDGVAELVADPAAADFLLNTGPDPERGSEDASAYLPALEAAARHQLPMLCVNPDRHVMVGAERLICAGALADLYKPLCGDIFEVGKPDPAVYDPVLELLGIDDRRRVVAIGDTPHTDLAGAQAAGLDALWALTGLAQHALGDSPTAETLRQVALREGVDPIAALRALRW